ncbi:PREDICTED: vesicle transport through interaction with t-SNAREs homolog 1A [Leptosomus discolor]|uniref:vesicle transport through interaction with t-SNAREs homolog 1A n=1 Tax=Leptosomus discolor TaxID=188344 RepID=UPI000522AAAF|nr:PREDICTED: vesicle transport through interaction with t-SNAREs homolog 1A [Leptosomus discolor]
MYHDPKQDLRNICKIFASSSPEVPVSSCGDGWESLKKRIMRWEGDVRRDAHEVAVFSSSDLREIADGLLPPRWKKQDERYEKKQMVANVEKQLEEARELLEQMELEVREIPPQSRGMYSSRMRSYKQEMGKLEADFKRSRIAYSDEVRNELLGDDGNSSENQLIKLREERAHLLDNTERLERSSRRLEAGYQIAVETEQIGQEMLENLSHDREKIQRARERLRETDANLGKSSRILTGMLRR